MNYMHEFDNVQRSIQVWHRPHCAKADPSGIHILKNIDAYRTPSTNLLFETIPPRNNQEYPQLSEWEWREDPIRSRFPAQRNQAGCYSAGVGAALAYARLLLGHLQWEQRIQ